jgi:hypothetical protein
MERRDEILAQIERCRQMTRWETNVEAQAAIKRLQHYYEEKLAALERTASVS